MNGDEQFDHRAKRHKARSPFDSPPNGNFSMSTVWKGKNKSSPSKKHNQKKLHEVDDDNENDDRVIYERITKKNPFSSPPNGKYGLNTVCRKGDRSNTDYRNNKSKPNPFNSPKNGKYSLKTVCRHKSVSNPEIIPISEEKPMRIKNKKRISSESEGDNNDFISIKTPKRAPKKIPKQKKILLSTICKPESISKTESISKPESISISATKLPKRKKKNINIDLSTSSEDENVELKQRIAKYIEPTKKSKKLLTTSPSEESIETVRRAHTKRNTKSIFTVAEFRNPRLELNDDSIKPLNLSIIENPAHPKFKKELSEAEIRLKPNQYDSFFKILSEHFRSNTDDIVLNLILKTIPSVLNTEESFDSLCKSGLIKFLPYEEDLIDRTMNILNLVFQFRPNAFQENFVQTMNQIIHIRTEESLNLLSFYAQSFEYIESPWEILDLLIKNEDLFLIKSDTEISSRYISILYFLSTNFVNFERARLKYCRPIFIKALDSNNKKCVEKAYKAIASLYDSDFKIPISRLFNDISEKTNEDYALQILSKNRNIPIKEDYIFALMNSAHRKEEAALIILRLLKNEKVATILINNSKWMKHCLPTVFHTLSIFKGCIQFDNLADSAKDCKELPFFLMMLLHSNDVECIHQLSVILNRIQFEDFAILEENKFFELLLQEITETSNTLSCIAVLTNLADLNYSTYYLKFVPILKKCLKNSDTEISHGALHALANLSQHNKCAALFQEQNVLHIALKYCTDESDAKYLKKLRKNC